MADLAVDATGPEWLVARRNAASELAASLPLPGPKDKGWEFTDLSKVDLDAFPAVSPAVTGFETSSDGVVVLPLAEAAESHREIVEKHLGSLVADKDPFVARNDRDWKDGVFVYVPAGQRLEGELQLDIAQEQSGSTVTWRTLIVVEEGGEAEVWERFISPDGTEGIFNGVTELVVGQGATLRYICQQDLADEGLIFATQRGIVARDGNLEWVSLGFGSGNGKVRMETKLDGPGADAKVTGAYASNGSQHIDYDTIQEHAAPHTTSDLAFRGVLGDSSTTVWRGMIIVDKEAQQTDAFQENRNLLLTRQAHADAIPGLEIEADDVRCTHAAAIAQVDEEQLFYLRSRGLDEDDGTRLVVEGFLAELTERLPEGEASDRLSETLGERLAELLA